MLFPGLFLDTHFPIATSLSTNFIQFTIYYAYFSAADKHLEPQSNQLQCVWTLHNQFSELITHFDVQDYVVVVVELKVHPEIKKIEKKKTPIFNPHKKHFAEFHSF